MPGEPRHVRSGTPPDGGAQVRFLSAPGQYKATRNIGARRNACAALRRVAQLEHWLEPMQTTTDHEQPVRPPAGVRLDEPAEGVHAHPARFRSPVLPRGWAPLTANQQRAVLRACDAAPERLAFRLGARSGPEIDYRVYQLSTESWAGLWVASRCFTDHDGIASNRDLLGLGSDVLDAVGVALGYFNSDLEARGEGWRLEVEVPAVPQGDPRRV
jgi:hypothetical protein